MKNVFLLILAVTTCISGSNLYGQRTLIYEDPSSTYNLGLELYQKEKYGAAKELFLKVIEAIPDEQSLVRADATYYAAVSAVELRHPNGQTRLTDFIDHYPGHVRVPMAWYHLGRIYYERKSYKRAADAFSKVRVEELTAKQKDEYYFAAGYTWFETGDYKRAKETFGILKEKDSKFKSYAIYYYAHTCYTDGDYDEALKNFALISDHPDFRPLIPYYYAQILYKQKRYAEMPTMITPLIDQKTTKRIETIARLIGDAYYKLNRYEEALGYMEVYLKEARGNINRIDAYQIGYVYYRNGDFANATEMFQKATGFNDSLSQNAYYHLADCYLQLGDKKFALNAFLEAYKLGFDPAVTEDALYNYAKLSYELALNFQNQAIKAFEQFLGDYPNSPNAAHAQVYLVNLYLSTNNYKSALTSIEKVRNQNDNMRAAFQKISYLRGIELFNDNLFQEAIDVFNKSLEFNLDKKTKALTHYWLGESWYRLEQWTTAREQYNKFQVAPSAFDHPEYNRSNYNLGYTLFKEKEYDPALIAFRKYLLKPGAEPAVMVTDATIRAADCYFMKKDYTNATAYYKQAETSKGVNTDYALYQHALSEGAMGKLNAKAELLEQLAEKHSLSSYRDDALYELGNTYKILDKHNKALAAYGRLIADYPGSSFEKSALTEAGLIYFNAGQEEQALRNLEKVVREYRGTPESKEALLTIRDIYTITDKVEAYYKYIKSLGMTVADTEKDSLAFTPAENYYLSGNCEAALKGFNNYLKQFPEGIFIINAHFYKAECEFLAKSYTEALEGYNFVTSQHRTKFTEAALARAAEIHIINNNCEGAIENYTRLEQHADNKLYIQKGRTGQMRCYSILGDHPKAYQIASRIIEENQLPEGIITEAYLILAKSAFAMDSIVQAQTWFEKVLKRTRNEMGAEAKYNLALIQYIMHNYDVAEKEIFELINDIPTYDYWIAKAFILLADVYVKTENHFQAKHTLQSIIDNYDGDDLVIEARKKLQEILNTEKRMEEEKAEEEIELRMNAPSPQKDGF